MDRRGGTSFAVFLILNPILILFYQNCSVVPTRSVASTQNTPIVSSQVTHEATHAKANALVANCRFVSQRTCAE